MYTPLSIRFKIGYLLLGAVLIVLVAGTVLLLTHHSRVRLNVERRSCVASPVSTQGFDHGPVSDALYRFVYDNVFRQDMRRGWTLTTDNERAGLSLRQWLTGNIPVVPEPVSVVCTVGAHQVADGWMAMLKINGTFYLAAIKYQDAWLVDYFMPMPHVMAPRG